MTGEQNWLNWKRRRECVEYTKSWQSFDGRGLNIITNVDVYWSHADQYRTLAFESLSIHEIAYSIVFHEQKVHTNRTLSIFDSLTHQNVCIKYQYSVDLWSFNRNIFWNSSFRLNNHESNDILNIFKLHKLTVMHTYKQIH